MAMAMEFDDFESTLHQSASAARRSCIELQTTYEERELVFGAAKMVNDVLGLEKRADAVEAALGRGDYAAAVSHVAPMVRAIAATDADAGGERAMKLVTLLRQRVSFEFAKAIASSDVGKLYSLAKLMPSLANAYEGRIAITGFAVRQLQEAADLREWSDSPSDLTHVSAALGRLLQRCAAMLESADDAIGEEMGGAGAREALTVALRGRCITLGAALGARFTSTSKLKSLVEDATRRLQKADSEADALLSGTAVDVAEEGERAALMSEGVVEGMCALLRGAIQWDAYMQGRTRGNGRAQGETLRHAPPFSEMARAVAVLGHMWSYANLSRAVRTQLQSVEGEVESEATASKVGEMVDSAFYVLQTSLRRAAHTCDGGISSAAIRHAADLLRKVVLTHLQGQLKQSLSAKLADAALGGARDVVRSAAEGMAVSTVGGAGASLAEAAGLAVSAAGEKRQLGTLRSLSALHLCVTYTPRLWRHAADDFGRSLPPSAVESAMSELRKAEGVQQTFEDALDAGLRQLSSALLPRLRPRFDAFATASYKLETEAAFAAAEGDTFVTGLLAEVELVLKSLSSALIDGARERLLQQLLQACVDRLEVLLLSKRVDQLGALQLDRDVRALTKRLGEIFNRSARRTTARLTQICTLINLETEAEAVGIWAAEGYEWRLSVAEAKQALSLRVDFRTDVINGLPLEELGVTPT